MVEVFKTNVQKVSQAAKLVELLHKHFSGNKINFDLKDCDNILRVEGENLIAANVETVITEKGFLCAAL